FSNCSNSLTQMDRYSFDFINTDYHPDVVESWQNGGCYEEMRRRLGYRLELISSTLTPTTITINLRNTGFGHLANERRSYIVYRNVENAVETSLQIDDDARLWIKGPTHTMSQNIPLLQPGTYHLFLTLPDIYHDLKGLDERYSVRFANVNVFENETGYNDLNQELIVNNLSLQDFLADTNTDDHDV